jgi:sortase A
MSAFSRTDISNPGALLCAGALAVFAFFAIRAGTGAQPPPAPMPMPLGLSASVVAHAGLPVRLRIPRIRVDANIENVGLTASGAMDVPQKWEDAAWYQLGARPGDAGNAVIAGHLDSFTGTAVFWNLRKLQPGDEILVTDDSGAERRFRVERSTVFADEDPPMQLLFGPSPEHRLNLITCGGTWDEARHRYAERLAVFAVEEDGQTQGQSVSAISSV